ncbi:MAG: isoleucine--tRNA ligase [Deltaproteobacteria bacterium RIFOXYD12_FULL_57_12]|nr:MAG: isoleucine--tRNA ligase [Deltaproteobacteria bacterium RIFOXYD12_FULL_57_12]
MDYRATLNLPQTEFKMKANLAQNEPLLLESWDKADLYGQVQASTAGRPLYILHDGPPYANGHIHLGTAFNKVLKDIILKSRRMAGYHCPYVPGWDCHGLPIEHNVDKELGPKKREIGILAVRAACRRYAEKWIDIQRREFRRLGVLGDWDNPYLTISYGYEAAIAREFNRFLLAGSVVKSKKPVYWCSSCRTALAEAEVEYYDHRSPSIYVKFPMADALDDLVPGLSGRSAFVVIWTTTPWTLPANLAVALHPDFAYAAVAVDNEVWIMAEGLVEQAFAAFGRTDYEIIATFAAGQLAGRKCRHPFLARESLIILASYVTLDTGTGCVHTAPGHGREDYQSGLQHNLPVLSPVDDGGRFTDEAGPYAGMFILDANPVINKDLAASGLLVKEAALSHSYPHCWRCKKPVIFRATEQWFISMEENGLRRKALAAIKEVAWTPKWGMERIYGMVEARPDWCLSRQRTWGVPLTVFTCKKCGEVLRDAEVVARIDALFLQEGADAWFKHEAADFLGAETRCKKCGSAEFAKETDILDVWFDSGVSFAAVLEERVDLRAPADLYLEGSDQHRGWFQSSLLAAVGTRGLPPYHGVLTHGFVVDGQGKKMSKSIGNVIAPEEVIKKYGAEILRLWVASEDYRDDIKISDEILRQLSDAYRKVRNTIRYLLGNLADFDPARHKVAYGDLEELDRWALHQFESLKRKAFKAYEQFEFHTIFHALHQFCGVTMSAFYLDVIKDRLYTAPTDSRERRGAQTVLAEILEGLLRLMAPVLSFTAAEAWEYLPAGAGRESSVFLGLFPAEVDELLDPELDARWKKLLAVRAEITKTLELARQDKIIGHPLEAEVRVAVSGELADFLADKWETLKAIAIVSELVAVEDAGPGAFRSEEFPELQVTVRAAAGEKCERCWMRSTTVGQDSDHPQICGRCATAVAASR